MKARRIATCAVVGTLCAAAVLEQIGYAEAPQWFTTLGGAVVVEYIIEYWQDKHVDS
jgi:hypothetical protein